MWGGVGILRSVREVKDIWKERISHPSHHEGGIAMDKKERKLLEKILKQNVGIVAFATCDEGQPRVRPVSPIVDGLDIWITTFAGSRKVKHIKKNPRVCLSFVHHPDGEQRAIVVGKVKLVKDMKEKEKVWKLASFDLGKFFKSPKDKEFALLKIDIARIEWDDDWKSETKIYEP
jgi:general stress protein 26